MVGTRKAKGLLIFVVAAVIALYGAAGTAEAYTTTNVLGTYDLIKRSISTSTTGRYVTFVSDLSTFVSPDSNNQSDAFIKDTETGVISLLSITPSGDSGNARTDGNVIITGNGRYALFNSYATNLATTSGTYGAQNLYLRDLQTSTTYLIAAGTYVTRDLYPVGLSEDGRFIYYSSQGSDSPGVFVKDRSLNTTDRVDVNDVGTPANMKPSSGSSSNQKQVSCDGRFVVIASPATNLVTGDTNGVQDVFLIDQMGGHTVKSITLGANGYSSDPKISCDGNYVLFASTASNLVSSDTNNTQDLFRYKVSDGTIDRVSIKDDESEYAGVAYLEGAFVGADFDMSMDGRYVFFVRQQRTSSSNKNYLTMRDTKLGTTSVIAPSGSNYYPINPVASYDGSRVFYNSGSTVSEQVYSLHVVTNHLP